MTLEEFFSRCLTAGCFVTVVRAYSQYNDAGNTSAEYCIGVRYAAMENKDGTAVAPDNFFMVEECHTGPLYETPEAALAAWERKMLCTTS